MTLRCPLCSQPLEPTLRARLTDLLWEAHQNRADGLSTAHLARQTGKSKPMVLNALRRMEAAGSARRVLLEGGPGANSQAWAIVPDLELPEVATQTQPEADLIGRAIDSLLEEIRGFRLVSVDQAVAYLRDNGDLDEDTARDILGRLVQADQIEINGEAVSA